MSLAYIHATEKKRTECSIKKTQAKDTIMACIDTTISIKTYFVKAFFTKKSVYFIFSSFLHHLSLQQRA